MDRKKELNKELKSMLALTRAEGAIDTLFSIKSGLSAMELASPGLKLTTAEIIQLIDSIIKYAQQPQQPQAPYHG